MTQDWASQFLMRDLVILQAQRVIHFIEKEMKQTREEAGHIELVQGSKYTKHVKLMLLICARDKRLSNISERIFPPG